MRELVVTFPNLTNSGVLHLIIGRSVNERPLEKAH